ncbi:hypothetical protein BDC45DRAFT_541888 [Circinella umbellata]|nr:hypothetical protein BDC45DRAFT_541888 [Circinella umbellata]
MKGSNIFYHPFSAITPDCPTYKRYCVILGLAVFPLVPKGMCTWYEAKKACTAWSKLMLSSEMISKSMASSIYAFGIILVIHTCILLDSFFDHGLWKSNVNTSDEQLDNI